MKTKEKNSKSDSQSERVLVYVRILFRSVYVRIRTFTEDELSHDKTTPIEALDTKNNAMTSKKKYKYKII